MQAREQVREATYQDVIDAPERMTAEILDGELHLTPRPRRRHSRAHIRLASRLRPFFDPDSSDEPGGWIIDIEPELLLARLRDNRREPVVPDLAGWKAERLLEADPDTWQIEVPPDWVCEILSPTTQRKDRVLKMPLYAHNGVTHVWLVDPTGHTLEAFVLEEGRWVLLGTWSDDDKARVAPFDAVELDLSRLWFAEPPPAGP